MNRLSDWLLPSMCRAQSSSSPPPEDIGAKFSTTVVESLFGTTVVDPTRLHGQIYYLKPGTAALPNFKKLKPVGSIYTNGFNIPRTAFDEAFPASRTASNGLPSTTLANSTLRIPGNTVSW